MTVKYKQIFPGLVSNVILPRVLLVLLLIKKKKKTLRAIMPLGYLPHTRCSLVSLLWLQQPPEQLLLSFVLSSVGREQLRSPTEALPNVLASFQEDSKGVL